MKYHINESERIISGVMDISRDELFFEGILTFEKYLKGAGLLDEKLWMRCVQRVIKSIIRENHGKYQKVFFARCHPCDQWDENVGLDLIDERAERYISRKIVQMRDMYQKELEKRANMVAELQVFAPFK